MVYSPIERAFFLLKYVEAQYSYADFKKKVQATLPVGSRIPDTKSVQKWKKLLLDTGNLEDLPHSMPKIARTMDNVEAVRQMVYENSNVSVRQIHNALGISVGSVHKILTEDLHLYPYKAQITQELKPGDPEERSKFARAMMRQKVEYPEISDNLIFFDEALFHLEGVPNRQNYRNWAETNPNVVITETLHPQKVHALMGIGRHGLIGPFFFETNVNADAYIAKLRDEVIPALASWPNRQELIIVHDGATPHYAVKTRQFIAKHFKKLIGRGSTFLTWPARSPDLTPMDYFLWGHLKQKLYRGQVFPSLDVLKTAIRTKAAEVPLEMINDALDNFWKRLLICERNGGLSVETRDNDYDDLF